MRIYEPYGIFACLFLAIGILIPRRPATRYFMLTGTLLLGLYSWFTHSWSTLGLSVVCVALAIYKSIKYRRKNVKGAIICGYPGIGKSSVACSDLNYIDLESSYFKKGDDLNWYISYCNAALDLYAQGHYVFVSCHMEVREYLISIMNDNIKFDESRLFLCYPHENLRNPWIKRLENRKIETNLAKDIRSYEHVCKCFYKDIEELNESLIQNKIILIDLEYDLKKVLSNKLKY